MSTSSIEGERIQGTNYTTSSSRILDELFLSISQSSISHDENINIVDHEKQLMKNRPQLFHQLLKQPQLYQEFNEFMTFSKSARFVFLLNVIFTLLFVIQTICTFWVNPTSTHTYEFIVVLLEFLLGGTAIVFGWLLFSCILESSFIKKIPLPLGFWKREWRWNIITDRIQAIFYLSLICAYSLFLTHRTWNGECENTAYMHSFRCNPQNASHIFPFDSALLLMMIPLLFSVVYRETRIRIIACVWIIIFFSLLFCCILLQSLESYVICALYLMISSIIIIDTFKEYLLFYWLGRQLKKTIEENQRLAEQNKATEMRHLIANVAHDLKTPLSSFMTGIEIISNDVLEFEQKTSDFCQSRCSAINLEKEYVSSLLSGLKACINNVQNTNSFMLMTINRCLDYTKSSNGMKLVPKHETVEVMEALNMPLQCMMNIQQRITIELLPLEETITKPICSHIITDKQWLQENVLCLLSNAVKYSNKGDVKIKVLLIEFPEGATRTDASEEDCRSKHTILSNRTNKGNSKTPYWLDPRALFAFFTYSHKILPSLKPSNPWLNDDVEQQLHMVENDSPKSISQYLMFEVIDTGIGISEEAMKSLFSPFMQTQKLAGGTGLGLYSLARRIDALHGKYGVRQRDDGIQGSIFWFSIPYKPDEVTAAQFAISADDSPPIAVRPARKLSEAPEKDHVGLQLSILLAEDTPSIAKMITMMLHRQNHSTDVAENGQIALDKLYHFETEETETERLPYSASAPGRSLYCKYDVVLMDLQMPVMDGLEATRRIRARERDIFLSTGKKEHQIVIGVSANSDHETMEEALCAGIDEFLPKPFSVDAFLEVVHRVKGKEEI